MASEAQIEANRRNAKKSTGPRSQSGRDKARFNAVKHGFRAEKAVMPGEDPAALQERLDDWSADLQPRNSVEQYLVDRGVRLSWQLDRVLRAQDARLTTQIIGGGDEETNLQEEEILEIGQRLFWDNRGPLNFYPHKPIREDGSPGDGGPRTSFCESPDDPDQPALLVRRLRSNAAGCQWMLDRWTELETLVECQLAWMSPDKLKAIRLLGKQPIDAIDDLDVARIFLASYVIRGETGEPFHEIIHELFVREEAVFRLQVASRQLTMFKPKDAAEARAVLAELVADAKARLTAQIEVHLKRDNEIEALAADRLAFDDSLPGEQLRRYEMTSGRALNRQLELLLKLRLTGEKAGFATAHAADLSGSTVIAKTNVQLITTASVETAGVLLPPPNEAVAAGENAPNEANPTGPGHPEDGSEKGASENAPNEANPAGPGHPEDGWENFEACEPKEERREKPEIDTAGPDRTERKAEDESVEAQWGYWEHQMLERELTRALRN
jgi:hypothetical protein